MATKIDFTKILQDRASFQLVRTNPKLTGNIKLTIDENDKMWLNSIEVNDELSKSSYKKRTVDPTMSLASNVYRFFNDGLTPSEIVFDLKENFDSTKTSSDYKDQYDFSKYFSGARYLASRQYEEKMSYFAPIFLKKDLPDYFIIFKINDPLNRAVNSDPYDKEEYIKEMFKKSSIIKTFDLRETTKVGKFLRTYIEDPNFPVSPLDVSYDENSLTNFNGIIYDNGVLGSRGELLSDFYKTSNPLKYFEEFITLGFERNGVIFPNILNLEFIFDDNTSEYYDFNRYIGFYINEIELSQMDVNLDGVWNRRKTDGNTPIIKREYFEWEDVNITQENEDGVIIPFKNSGVLFSDFENAFLDKDNMFFNYIKDRNDSIHSLNLNDAYDIDYLEGIEQPSAKLRLSDTKINLGDFFGPGKLLMQDKGTVSNDRGYSSSYIKILGKLNHLDAIKFYHPNGTRSDSNGKYELIQAVLNYPELSNPGDYYSYNDIDGVAGHDTFYFNGDGDGYNSNIASAIAGCINDMRNIAMKAYAVNEYVFIKSRAASDSDHLYKLEFVSQVNEYDKVEIGKKTGTDLIGQLIQFQGGSRVLGNRLIIDGKHFDKINSRLDDILVKTTKGWSKISKISNNIDSITEENLITPVQKRNAIDSYFNKMDIVLDLEDSPKLDSGEFTMRLKHRPPFGFISFFPIKDFDFDFYSSEYLNFPQIDLYKHYYIPSGLDLLEDGVEYKVYGTGSILYGGATKNVGDIFKATSANGSSYSIISGDPIVSYPPIRDNDGELLTSVGTSLWHEINDDNEEFKDFPGFFLLKDPSVITPESDSDVYMLRDKYLNGLASSEYDYYKENSTKDFALRSKIIPYITKWVIPDGLDSRSNYYRLNSELVFGFNNFTPDHEDTTQNPANFTHEWFYVESAFNFRNDPETLKLNNSYFEQPFDLDEALTNPDYFIEYFTYTPTYNGNEIGKTQTRYSPITKNSQGVYETFPKGFKIQFKDYIDATNLNAAGKPEWNSKSNRFEDYKFTCLLKTVKEDINDDTIPPIRYRFIEHKDFKFIILLIELKIGGSDSIHDIWKNSTYEGITNESHSGVKIKMFDKIAGDPAFTTINGDYRINFNTLDTSDVTYTSLYSLKNKKFNNLDEAFSNISASFKLSLKKKNNSLAKFKIDDYANYPSKINEEMIEISPNVFIGIRDKSNESDLLIDSVTGISPENVNPISEVDEDFVYFDSDTDIAIVNELNLLLFSIPPGIPNNNYIKQTYVFKIIAGGELYFEKLLQKLSFAKFKEYVNDLDPFIEYHSYVGTELTKDTSNFYAEIPNRSIIEKKDALLVVNDTNKPGNLSFNSIIGYNYERASLDNSYDINRYEGGFSPLFKDLFYFKTKFIFSKNGIDALDSGNVSFNIDLDDFLKIINFNHIKISNSKILSLESDEEFDPLYEIPGEIAIGRSDYNLLNSNWDYGFHLQYNNKTTKSPVSGTLRIEEDDCFVSKLIKLRDVIELEEFDVQLVSNIQEVNIDNIELIYQEKDTTIVGYINIKNALISYLISDGIINKFTEFLIVSPEYLGSYESIEDYVRDYVDVNIVKLYEIDTIEFYTKEDKELIEDSKNSNLNKIQFELLNDKERFDDNYKLNKNLQINKIDRYMLKFEFAKSLNSGTLISPKIKIKFI
jgi:hypothetical protein